MMADIAHAGGYLVGAFGIAFAISFGLYGGFVVGTWAFGALNINVKRGDLNIIVRDTSEGK
jgi:hypothetical protein